MAFNYDTKDICLHEPRCYSNMKSDTCCHTFVAANASDIQQKPK